MHIIINEIILEHFATSQGDVPLWVWELSDQKAEDVERRIHKLLLHNHNLQRYLVDHWNEIEDFKIDMIFQMLQCVQGSLGGMVFRCNKCGHEKFLPFSCNSRVCVRCGKKYAEQWGRTFMNKCLPQDHRHVIFTLPPPLWELIKNNEEILLKDMLDAAKAVIEQVFTKQFKGRKIIPGMIAVIHFIGRGLNYNPHIHMLATEGGLNKVGNWEPLDFFPYKMMNECWKAEILRRFRFHMKHDLDVKALIDSQWKYRFGDGTNGYVVKNFRNIMDLSKGKEEAKQIGSYFARYLRHPPVGESRLKKYDGETVTVKYEWDNKLLEVEVSIECFISALFLNIPPKGFKLVRWWGLYSPRYSRWARRCLCIVRMVVRTLESFSERYKKKSLPRVVCQYCKVVMQIIEVLY